MAKKESDRGTLRPKKDTLEKLSKLKKDDESWDDFLIRVVETPPKTTESPSDDTPNDTSKSSTSSVGKSMTKTRSVKKPDEALAQMTYDDHIRKAERDERIEEERLEEMRKNREKAEQLEREKLDRERKDMEEEKQRAIEAEQKKLRKIEDDKADLEREKDVLVKKLKNKESLTAEEINLLGKMYEDVNKRYFNKLQEEADINKTLEKHRQLSESIEQISPYKSKYEQMLQVVGERDKEYEDLKKQADKLRAQKKWTPDDVQKMMPIIEPFKTEAMQWRNMLTLRSIPKLSLDPEERRLLQRNVINQMNYIYTHQSNAIKPPQSPQELRGENPMGNQQPPQYSNPNPGTETQQQPPKGNISYSNETENYINTVIQLFYPMIQTRDDVEKYIVSWMHGIAQSDKSFVDWQQGKFTIAEKLHEVITKNMDWINVIRNMGNQFLWMVQNLTPTIIEDIMTKYNPQLSMYLAQPHLNRRLQSDLVELVDYFKQFAT